MWSDFDKDDSFGEPDVFWTMDDLFASYPAQPTEVSPVTHLAEVRPAVNAPVHVDSPAADDPPAVADPTGALDPSDDTEIMGPIWNAPVLGTRSSGEGTVDRRFREILGCEIYKNELITLQQGLFRDIFPRSKREEKRVRAILMASFEAHRMEVLQMLDSPHAVKEVLRVVLAGRRKQSARNLVYAHIWNIH
jgi:hypothetical protein